jgi:hypothetical protein
LLLNLFLHPLFNYFFVKDIWSVRKAVAESMMDVSLALDPDERLVLVQTMCTLLEDDEHWVSDTAYEYLGPFLTTL